MNWKQNWPVALFEAVSILLVGGMTTVYLLHIGEPNPVETETNLLTSGFALLATWLAISGWTLLAENDPGRREWTLFSIGIGLWTMAELLWAFLSYTLRETPYPSVADAFWVPGYVMIIASAAMRYRAFRIEWNSRRSRVLLAAFLLILLAVFVLVIVPVLLEGAESLLVLLLNLFYPIADLLVLFAALMLALSLAGGRFSAPWKVLAAGLATLSLSDILFIYSDANGLYTPDGHLTWLTALVDMSNLCAYVLIAHGMLLNQRLLSGKGSPNEAFVQEENVPLEAQKVMIFIDSADKVVFANQNLLRLLREAKTSVAGMSLGETLGLSSQDEHALLTELHNARRGRIEKYLAEYREDGVQIEGWLRGQANFNDLREYTGADIVCELQSRSPNASSAGLRERLLISHGTLMFDSQEHKILLDYFSHKVYALYVALTEMGGNTVASAFESLFQTFASQENALLSFKHGTIQVERSPEPNVYGSILDALTEYARNTLSRDMVAAVFKRTESSFSPETLGIAKKFGLKD